MFRHGRPRCWVPCRSSPSLSTRLGIGQVIDDLVPIRPVASLTVGQAVEAMICNRLTSPAPLVHVADWARDWAVPEILGIPALALNDDKLGRTLDAIAPRLEEITGAVAVRAIGAFGIDIGLLHWDMTSFSLYGAYPEADEDYPAPAYGHPKDRRTDLLQIQAGIAAAGDGGIPVYARAYSGGDAEISQVTGAMTALPEDRRGEEVPADRGLQADQLWQRRRDQQSRLHVPGPRVQDVCEGR